jgi:hypothetical protein
MTPIPQLKCAACRYSASVYKSTRWPSVGLCHRCWEFLCTWFVANDVIHENPVAEELLGGVWNQNPKPDHYEIVYRTQGTEVFVREMHVRRVKNKL